MRLQRRFAPRNDCISWPFTIVKARLQQPGFWFCGRAEIIIGAGPDPRKNGQVIILRIVDGLYTLESFIAYEGSRYGVYVAAGDLDGDGKAEILTGSGPGPRNKPIVRIFRDDGTLMGEFQAYPDYMKFGVRVFGGWVGE